MNKELRMYRIVNAAMLYGKYEAKIYLRRNLFVLNGPISSVGKKLAAKCEGKPFV